MSSSPLLEMLHITKQYPGVLALDDVTFDLYAGEVHCLVGENGAGKTTLIKILSGALPKDVGELRVNGKPVFLHSPADAFEAGIGIIHQDFKLVPELTVAENIFLGREPCRGRSPFIDFEKMREGARAVLAQLGESLDPRARIGTLSVAQRQVVEIAKSLSGKNRILAMDEPSAALTGKELKNLFAVIRRMQEEGVGIIYISHRIDEIFEIGTRVTVLRDGKHVHTCKTSEADRRGLVSWMVGREMDQEYPKVRLQRGKEILRLENLNGGKLRNIHLAVYQGEILGLAGLVGAGRTELARLIFGADRLENGRILLDGKEIHPHSPRDAIDAGIGLLTEDRNRYGLIMEMSIEKNITLSNLKAVSRGGFIQGEKERGAAQQFAEELRIKTPSLDREVSTLSGGNRQKVVLARWLFTRSRLLLFDEPTAGIDVGVKYEIYNLLNQLALNGKGVVIISSDLPELLGLCDRIVVLCEGRITGELSREEATEEKIMLLATSVVDMRGHRDDREA
ncbi:MAG: sugar ABC transporter ATP-binding protein [Acidobacteriia bacterium]|nr:sugar ABC transporter ATP-binding protein [Terriglobia bacterium]